MISLMILLITFTGTTYAWFKINSSASVSGFNFTVTGGEGYQISLTGEEGSYSSQLTSAQMRQAILCGYSRAYSVKNGKLYLNSVDEISDAQAIIKIKEAINLSPVTTHYIDESEILSNPLLEDEDFGKLTFQNLYGSNVDASSGKYIEFSIYVQANGAKGENNKYSLYLLGSNVEDVVDSNNNVVKLAKTSIQSIQAKDENGNNRNEIKLKRDMETIKYDHLNAGQTVTVYTSNALRFSIGDDNEVLGKKNDVQVKHTNQIYEISDDQQYDLGSYATTYPYANQADKTAGIELPATKRSTELDNLYNATKNAMYTYYNNIRPYSLLPSPLNYDEKPETIRNLPDEDEIKNASNPLEVANVFVEVMSGFTKKVTFRFWLEGWDADCFDGISESIRVNLSFASLKNGKKTR